jgi:hypothetical protein
MNMDEDVYDVICRPGGGVKLVAGTCEDGFVHLFGYVDDIVQHRPACSALVTLGPPAKDEDPMCPSCATAAESWVQGGALKVST